MRPIPPKLKSEMEKDPFYRRCAVTGKTKDMTKIEWHHNLIYAGRQVNEKWCIIPLAYEVHDKIQKYKEIVDWIMLNRATDDDLRRYSKAVDLIRKRAQLNKQFGTWDSKKIKSIPSGGRT